MSAKGQSEDPLVLLTTAFMAVKGRDAINGGG
jgi:hypothetical protein